LDMSCVFGQFAFEVFRERPVSWTELAKRPCQTLCAVLPNLWIAFVALVDESNSFMQDLPNHAAAPGRCLKGRGQLGCRAPRSGSGFHV